MCVLRHTRTDALYTHDMRLTWCAWYCVSIFSSQDNVDPQIQKSNGNGPSANYTYRCCRWEISLKYLTYWLTHLVDSIVHYCTICLTRKMPPHNLIPCCNLCLFYSPPQVHFVDVFWMTSRHVVFGRPGLIFPWDGFQWYSLLGIQSMFIRCKWPNYWRQLS